MRFGVMERFLGEESGGGCSWGKDMRGLIGSFNENVRVRAWSAEMRKVL